MLSGNGPHGFGAGRPWPVDATPSRAAVCASYTTSRQMPASTQRDPPLGDALEVERQRQPGRVVAVVDDRDEVAADALAGLGEAAFLLDGQGGEAEVAEHVQQVHDRVFLEDDRVVAGVDGDRVGGRAGLAGRLAAERRRVDGRGVHGGRLGVAGAAVGPIDTVMSCEVVRVPDARTPCELATAIDSGRSRTSRRRRRRPRRRRR